MLHRLSLRVLPQLNALVTAPPVRKRKRWVMLAPGLVAFAVYHALKQSVPLSHPLVLLVFSGTLSAITAVWAFRQGRELPLRESFRTDGVQRWMWLIGWVGFVYGIQLSLLVLAILQIFVNYDFLLHPEGPAMMAIIISCTSVTRDAFEIGYVQRLVKEGALVPTFPDGQVFRSWLTGHGTTLATWNATAVVVGLGAAWAVWAMVPLAWQPVGQAIAVSSAVATVSLMAFLAGQEQFRSGADALGKRIHWFTGLWFWVWPSLTFAATYFLVMWGGVAFVLRSDVLSWGFAGLSVLTACLMTTYTLYLGWRKAYEEEALVIPESVQRCPFVMGILQNSQTFLARKSTMDLKPSQSSTVNER